MNRKIMLIEDDKDIVEVMDLILTDEGYEVLSSADGKLLKEIEHHQPMMILMDNRLTTGFGEDYCRQLKKDPATAHYPVVLVSASNNIANMAYASHADAYLRKPFDISELMEIVNRFDPSEQCPAT